MDDLFQILIYALIIISFLSSLFKKKKPQEKPKGTSREQTRISFPEELKSEPRTQSESGSNYDVDLMKEFERLFKVETETETDLEKSAVAESKQPSLERSTPIEIQQRQKDLERTDVLPTESEHRYENIWDRKKSEVEKKTSKIDSSIENQAAQFEKHLQVKESSASEITKKIRDRLRDPATLKDYIVISELMGKPKALRR